MRKAWYHHLLHGLLMLGKGILVVLLLCLLAAGIDLAIRPLRYEVKAQLFQGIHYTRLIRSKPRPLVIHVVDIDLTAPGIRILVTPGDRRCGMDNCAMTTGEFVDRYHLQIGINGSFFAPFVVGHTFWDYYPHTNDPVDIQGLAISNGGQYSKDDPRFVKICFTQATAQITPNACPQGTLQALAGREIIVQNGAAVKLSYGDGINPRTVVGTDRAGKRLCRSWTSGARSAGW